MEVLGKFDIFLKAFAKTKFEMIKRKITNCRGPYDI
jgi:hypothetical protein